MYKGFLVDDDISDLTYVKLLSFKTNPGLSLTLKEPSQLTEIAASIFDDSPDIVALDYRLDENFSACPAGQYKAGPLAQQLRDLATASPQQDFPIILISSEEKIQHDYKPDATSHDLFDNIYLKENVSKNTTQYRSELIGLIEGYQTLKKHWAQTSTVDKLCHILNLSPDEYYAVDFEELHVAVEDSKAVHVLARVLIQDVLRRPGILLSWDDIRAKLGVAFDSLDQEKLKQRFEEARYQGAFYNAWERWWRHKFDEITNTIFNTSPTGLPGDERVTALNQQLNLSLTPAQSRWSTENPTQELFAFPCAVCRHPTELRHSLAAYDPRAPKFAERKRICWDCIRKDRNEQPNIRVRIAGSDLSLAGKIKNHTVGQ